MVICGVIGAGLTFLGVAKIFMYTDAGSEAEEQAASLSDTTKWELWGYRLKDESEDSDVASTGTLNDRADLFGSFDFELLMFALLAASIPFFQRTKDRIAYLVDEKNREHLRALVEREREAREKEGKPAEAPQSSLAKGRRRPLKGASGGRPGRTTEDRQEADGRSAKANDDGEEGRHKRVRADSGPAREEVESFIGCQYFYGYNQRFFVGAVIFAIS